MWCALSTIVLLDIEPESSIDPLHGPQLVRSQICLDFLNLRLDSLKLLLLT